MSTTKETEVRYILTEAGIEDVINQIVGQLANSLIHTRTKEQANEVFAQLHQHNLHARALDAFVEDLAHHLTDDEVDAYFAFHRTPVGRSIATKVRQFNGRAYEIFEGVLVRLAIKPDRALPTSEEWERAIPRSGPIKPDPTPLGILRFGKRNP